MAILLQVVPLSLIGGGRNTPCPASSFVLCAAGVIFVITSEVGDS
jgi:hypothetical protein